jgi:hypothetical protein
VDDAKRTAESARKLGGAVYGGLPNKGGRPRKDGLPPGSGPSRAITAPVVAEPPFIWNEADIKLLGDAPFDLGYTLGGPDHGHWKEARESINSGGAYKKFAYVANRLGFQNPVYLVLALGLVEYTGAIGKCAAYSWNIWQEKRERLAAEKEARERADLLARAAHAAPKA